MDGGEVAGQADYDYRIGESARLASDIQVINVRITNTNGAYPRLDTNGHNLVLDGGAIIYESANGGVIEGTGTVTSSRGYVGVKFLVDAGTQRYFYINSQVSDYGGERVNLTAMGDGYAAKVLYLAGEFTNTFTGNTFIDGSGTILALGKTGGATAIQGNIYIANGASLSFCGSDQIADSSTVNLKNATIYFAGIDGTISERIHQLTVDAGSSAINFDHIHNMEIGRLLLLDDLFVSDNSQLLVRGWEEGRDFLLVKKTSAHLSDSLKRIIFHGYDPSLIHLDDYNSEYWSVSGAPEPAAYGAALGAVGLGLCCWRRARAPRSQPAQ